MSASGQQPKGAAQGFEPAGRTILALISEGQPLPTPETTLSAFGASAWVSLISWARLAALKNGGLDTATLAIDRADYWRGLPAMRQHIILVGDIHDINVTALAAFELLLTHGLADTELEAIGRYLQANGACIREWYNAEACAEGEGAASRPQHYRRIAMARAADAVKPTAVGAKAAKAVVEKEPVTLVTGLGDDRFIYSNREYLFGTRIEDGTRYNGYPRCKIPKFGYDLGEKLALIPQGKKPGILLAFVDAFMENCPRGVAAFPGLKILVMGDTHHGQQPLLKMLNYIATERYDYVVTLHNPQHLHFLSSVMPEERLAWLPNLNLKSNIVPLDGQRNGHLCFAGRLGQYHPYRTRLLVQLLHETLPFHLGVGMDAEALHGSSTVCLNISLNGDFNLRTFGILACGGFLLTDRPRPQLRLNQLLEEGKHYETYKDYGELKAKAALLLKNQQETEQRAQLASRRYWLHFSPERMRERLRCLIAQQAIEKPFRATADPRSRVTRAHSKAELARRLTVYGIVQEHHRKQMATHLLASQATNIRHLCDLSDLARLEIQQLRPPAQTQQCNQEILRQCGIDWVQVIEAAQAGTGYDLGLITGAELENTAVRSVLRLAQHWIVVSETPLAGDALRALDGVSHEKV